MDRIGFSGYYRIIPPQDICKEQKYKMIDVFTQCKYRIDEMQPGITFEQNKKGEIILRTPGKTDFSAADKISLKHMIKDSYASDYNLNGPTPDQNTLKERFNREVTDRTETNSGDLASVINLNRPAVNKVTPKGIIQPIRTENPPLTLIIDNTRQN